MAKINKKREQSILESKIEKDSHLNFMGGKSFDIHDPFLRLQCIAASCFFGEPQYYKDDAESSIKKKESSSYLDEKILRHLHEELNSLDDYSWRSLSPSEVIEKAIDESLDKDVEKTLKLAVSLRNEDNTRTTPQVIMVRAANHKNAKGTGLIRKYAKEIIKRLDEPAVQMAYQLSAFGKPIPNSLKRAWKDVLSDANEYSLAKYRMESRIVKTVDVMNLAHPSSPVIDKLAKGELKLKDDIQTWESIISGKGKWEDAVKVMGHMALLRNIRNFISNGVNQDLWLEKFVKTAETGKQLPFRYLTAYNMVKDIASGKILDAIETALELSIGNLPMLKGKSLILTDNSGSTQGCPISELSKMNVAQIGNLMGVLTGMRSEEGVVGVFGDRIKYLDIRKKSSILDQTKKLEQLAEDIGQGTENGIWLAFDKAIKEQIHYDNIFVYSDMQAGHGRLYGQKSSEYSSYMWQGTMFIDVPKLVKEYRNKVNPKVNVFLCQIAGYEDTLLPEYYEKTYIIGGWSDRILHFADKMSTLI